MKRLTLTLTLMLAAAMAFAQKPALDHSVYDSWKSLRGVSIPQNGDILMYTISPGEGDATLVIENIRTNAKVEVPRASKAKLSQDGKKVVAVISPLFSQTRAAKIKKAKKEDMPKDTLAIIDIASGKIEKFANYKSHNTPDKLPSYIAFELTPAKEKPAPKGKPAPEEKDAKKPEAKEKKVPAPVKELYVMNIATGTMDTIKNVASYKFNKEGNLLAYVVEPEKKDTTGKAALMLYTPATGESKEVLALLKSRSIR